MDDSWRQQRHLHERIRWARLHRTEFARPIDGARSLGFRPGTYRTYEQAKADGGREPPVPVVQQIARKYGVSWRWLLTGDGSPDDTEEPTPLMVVSNDLAKRLEEIPQDKRADALAAVEGVLAAYVRKTG